MRKFLLGMVTMLLLSMVSVPTMAQGTIADVASSNDDLSTLVDLIETADPSIAETLSGDGNYTVLAPTNLAFVQLADFLDMSVEDLQENPDVVTNILLYHVIEGEFTANQIRSQYDGGVVPTLLEGAFLNFDTLEDGTLQVNDVAEVVVEDVQASNGVVHVVNDVLLNRIITEELEGVQLEDAQADEDAADEGDDEMMAESTWVRFVHAVADAPAVDVYVDGEVAFAGVAPATISDFAELGAGTYSVAVAPADTSLDDAVFGPTELTLDAGMYTTVSAVGSLEEGTLDASVLSQEFAALDGQANLTVLHGIAGGPAVNVLVNGDEAVSGLEFPNSTALTTAADTYEVEVVAADSGDTLLGPAELTLEADTYYLAAAVIGEDGEPALLTAAEAAMTEDMDAMDDESSDESMSDDEATNEIDDIVATDDRFQSLLAAVQAADESIIDALGSSGPYTLFAPSNQAFTNLLADLDMTLEELASNQELLNQVLLYHVVDGEFTASDVAELDGESVETLLEGEAIRVTVGDDGSVSLNQVVTVTETDISADNGVIHIIDNVLLPQPVIEAMQEE